MLPLAARSNPRSSEKPTSVCNFRARFYGVRDRVDSRSRAVARIPDGSTLACYLPRETLVLPRRSPERVRESPFKAGRELGRHDKTHKVIHGEGSFITSYIAGLHCLGMLLSASVSRRITSSVRRYTRVPTLFSCPLAARASAPSFEEGFIRGTCSMILIISSLPMRITEICYCRR